MVNFSALLSVPFRPFRVVQKPLNESKNLCHYVTYVHFFYKVGFAYKRIEKLLKKADIGDIVT